MTRADFLILAGLAAVTILLWFVGSSPGLADVSGDLLVTVEVDGQPVDQFLLSDLDPGELRRVQGFLGYSVLEGGQNMVKMLHSPCPDKVCVDQGFIGQPGEAIICLPNRVIISISGPPRPLDLDAAI